MLKKLQSERGKSVKSKKNWKIKNYCIEKNCHTDLYFANAKYWKRIIPLSSSDLFRGALQIN